MTITPQQTAAVTQDLSKAYGVALTLLVETRKINAYRGSDGLYYLRMATGAEVGAEDFNAYWSKLLEYTLPRGEKILLLVDPTEIAYMTKGARKAAASEDVSAECKGVAILTRSSIAQALGRFFIFIDKPSVPTRLFVSVQEARQWLIDL